MLVRPVTILASMLWLVVPCTSAVQIPHLRSANTLAVVTTQEMAALTIPRRRGAARHHFVQTSLLFMARCFVVPVKREIPPCPELCGRRAAPGNSGFCSLCKPASASAPSLLRDAMLGTPSSGSNTLCRPVSASVPSLLRDDMLGAPSSGNNKVRHITSRCATPNCTKLHFCDGLRLHCSSGLLPCRSPQCTFRAPSNNDGLCLLCRLPARPRFCATPACTKVLHSEADSYCTLCVT